MLIFPEPIYLPPHAVEQPVAGILDDWPAVPPDEHLCKCGQPLEPGELWCQACETAADLDDYLFHICL